MEAFFLFFFTTFQYYQFIQLCKACPPLTLIIHPNTMSDFMLKVAEVSKRFMSALFCQMKGTWTKLF